jgi:hypothetical protein
MNGWGQKLTKHSGLRFFALDLSAEPRDGSQTAATIGNRSKTATFAATKNKFLPRKSG